MNIEISSNLRVIDPTKKLEKWCNENLVVSNPVYVKKAMIH